MKRGEFLMGEEANDIIIQYDNTIQSYKHFSDRLMNLIEELIDQENIVCHSITQRVKERDSLEGKLVRKKYKYKTISEITDIVGIRITTYYNDQVDEIAKLIEREFIVDRDNTIDKRKAMEPDRFGYLSLHYVIQLSKRRSSLPEYKNFEGYKAEIQVRTILQHAWAEIEHDLGYKTKNTIPEDVKRDFYRLAGLLELADKEFINIRKTIEHINKEKETMIENLITINNTNIQYGVENKRNRNIVTNVNSIIDGKQGGNSDEK